MLLVIAAAVVFGGTLAPLIADTLGLGTLSVGPPYFNPSFLVLDAAAAGAAVAWASTPAGGAGAWATPAPLLVHAGRGRGARAAALAFGVYAHGPC